MLFLFSFPIELEIVPEVKTKSPSPGQGPQQPRPGGKTLTSPGRPSELEARHVASPVYRHAEEPDLEGKLGLWNLKKVMRRPGPSLSNWDAWAGGCPAPGWFGSQIRLPEMAPVPSDGSSLMFKTVVSLSLMVLSGASRCPMTGLHPLLPTTDHEFILIGSKHLLKIFVTSMPMN